MNTQVDLYGKALTGTESELDKAKLARKWYLKKKMRRMINEEIGDVEEVLSAVTKFVVAVSAVSLGLTKDEAILDKIKTTVSKAVALYGAYSPMIEDVETLLTVLEHQLSNKYYVAKSEIDSAVTTDSVNLIDLPGEPTIAAIDQEK